jgi:hypothetical protein
VGLLVGLDVDIDAAQLSQDTVMAKVESDGMGWFLNLCFQDFVRG